MPENPRLSHDDYCRVVGQLYIDAELRIVALTQQIQSGNLLPLVQRLQAQVAKLAAENAALKAGSVPHDQHGT